MTYTNLSDYPDEWMSVREAADHLRVSDRTIRRLINTQQLRTYGPPGTRAQRIKRADLDRCMKRTN